MFIEDKNYLDQHFLIDKNVIKLFINTCSFTKKDKVIEIGPGKGVLSQEIKPLVKDLVLIEKDIRLKDYLNNYKVIYGNVLKIDIPDCDKIVSALPYSITEPFVYKLITSSFKEAILITGNKFALSVKNKDNNKLSLITNIFFDVNYIEEIKPDSFKPAPHALSAIIILKKHQYQNINEEILQELYYYKTLKIKNALKNIYIKIFNITQREAKKKILELNIDESLLNRAFELLNSDETNFLFNVIKNVEY